MTELAAKLKAIRASLAANNLSAARLRGTDWFSWATCGGSNTVLLASETGIADVLVTADGAWILSNVIEARRLVEEVLPEGFAIYAGPWQDAAELDRFTSEVAGGAIASDRPIDGELPLPTDLIAAKRTLLPVEVDRYRQLGADAAVAVSTVLRSARPDWTELRLAGEAARALWERGIHPTLTLVAGERRLPIHRHPMPTEEPLGNRAMLVVCARRHGLFANFTRFAAFSPLSQEERRRNEVLTLVEARMLAASTVGAALADVYRVAAKTYAELDFADEENYHHQGGTTGYLSREVVASSRCTVTIAPMTAVAWNPSLAGTKIEDTILVTPDGLESLSFDPNWPTTQVEGRLRPDWLEHA